MRRDRFALPPRRTLLAAATLVVAAGAIVFTLFMSPTASDRVFYASGVLLVAALSCCAQFLFAEPIVRRFVVGACVGVCAFHAVRFVQTYAAFKAENDARVALLEAAPPGTSVIVPPYDMPVRSRWHFGDDFLQHPWLGDYVGGELYDLGRVDVARNHRRLRAPRLFATRPLRLDRLPTYRELQKSKQPLESQRSNFVIHATDVWTDPRKRPLVVIERTADGFAFVDGRPHDEARGHFIRVRADSVPANVISTHVVGCEGAERVELIVDHPGADPLIFVDERFCRGPFTAIMCEPDRCWIAGWY
jgi:hypothetical protein